MSLACLVLKISRGGFFAPLKENRFSQCLGEIGLKNVFGSQKRIQDFRKHLNWRVLQQFLTTKIREILLQSAPY